MSEGVEWGLHSCLNLAWVGSERAVPSARLAEYYGLPAAYMNKQLQALARGGVVYSTPGPRGGFRLAREPEDITLMDVVGAIEGREEAFQCTEIRKRGPGAPDETPPGSCQIDLAMRRAELAWRRELGAQTLAEIRASVDRIAPGTAERVRSWFAGE
ncbi:RrF2 family transcriptional regulator [Nocardiopsis sp. NPDC050513]|uniref:RrF2 family transcriptional regulator n=1 Tax=Nocardiopsis sp. NPDC050513 TaxID=3364338 RepID=UPI0037B47677